MITLERRLAQEIVERTMRVIPFNVNVMDVHGIILGSGNPVRVGELHAGARLALDQARAVEIDDEATHALPGTQPGVNLPFKVRGQTFGVVGVTGQPHEVRQFGELVRVTAEMILEQALLVGELQREKRYREEFVDQLVNPGGTPHAELELWGARLGVDFALPRAVVILELSNEALAPEAALAELQICQQQLSAHDASLLMAAVAPRELVILKPFGRVDDAGRLAALAREQLFALDAVARKGLKSLSTMALGIALPAIEGVAMSYECARQTGRIGRARDWRARLFSYYDMSFPVLLSGLGSGWQAVQLREPLRRLQASERRSTVLRDTLTAWFAADCQFERAASLLGIHRNTLDYRLRQIGASTGLDLARISDRLLLYAALHLAG